MTAAPGPVTPARGAHLEWALAPGLPGRRNRADLGPESLGVKVVKLPENLGLAGGHNAGADACGGDVLLFLDDDGWFPDPQLGFACRQTFCR